MVTKLSVYGHRKISPSRAWQGDTLPWKEIIVFLEVKAHLFKLFNMDQRHYRPLIRINQPTEQNVYLPLDYAYSLPEVVLIKKYLPKTLVFYGVDSEEHG